MNFDKNLKKAMNLFEQKKEIPKNILSSVDKRGNSVAYYLVQLDKGWQTNDEEILKLSNNLGETIAYRLAIVNYDWTTDNQEILNLETSRKEKVSEVFSRRLQRKKHMQTKFCF